MGIPEIGPFPLAEWVSSEGKTVGFACGPGGCCGTCHRCIGYSVCHQYPCRCEHPCTCVPLEDDDGYNRTGCVRHDTSGDLRGDMSPLNFSGMRCPVCDPKKEFIRDPDCDVCDGHGVISMTAIDYDTRCLEKTPRAKLVSYGHTVCTNRAISYIWTKEGPRRWRPVCGVHLKRYIREDNIMEMERL